MSDEAIRATNDDATTCKKSAVDRGYWSDPYLKFVSRASERKAPEINRGYFARVASVQSLLRQFLKVTSCQCQVINVGAGFDTTFWNLSDQDLAPRRFIELDFKDVTSQKCRYIKSRKQLLEKLQSEDGEIQCNNTDFHSDKYHLVSCDLRNLHEVEQKLQECNCDMSLPTVFYAECVLVYMPSAQSSNLVKWIADKFTTVFFINYEQVKMKDRFGEVMVSNLNSRGCTLAGIDHCTSLETQQQRFLKNGWHNSQAADMNTVYKNLPQAEVSRIERLEFLDETEMLHQLFEHYCLSWSYKDDNKTLSLDSISISAVTS